MRTTVNIADDVLAAARALAAARGISLGDALSTLARRGLQSPGPKTTDGGFPVFDVPGDAPGFGTEEVRAAAEAEGVEDATAFLRKR